MFTTFPKWAALVAVSFITLASCDEAGPGGGQGDFRKQYFAAREALEDGKYDRANRAYLRLIQDAGALAPRLRLELSHSYLRAGEYDKASSEAAGLAAGQSGSNRAAALAVYGTAQHEMALALLAEARITEAKTHLAAARDALDEVLKTDAELDPVGALKGRKENIELRLKRLG